MKKFDAVYCINLDKRTDRWEKFSELWKEIDLDIERFPAIDGSRINIADDLYRHDDEAHNKSSMACSFSHIQLYERSIYYGHEEILILEDDAAPCPGFMKRLREFYSQLPSDYNLCYLGGSNIVQPEMITENVGKAINTKSTVGYLIKTGFAATLIPFIKQNLRSLCIDELLTSVQQQVPIHIFNPRLVHQYESYSDILERDIYYHWMKDI